MEQSFSARMCKIKTGAVSTASVSGSPSGSWPLPGQVDGSTAAGSHDQGHPKKARIQDADSINSQDRNHICSSRQEFVARFRDHGLPYSVDSPFCNTSAAILVRQSTSPEDREIGRRFAPLLEVVAPKLQEIFPERDTEGKFVVPAPDFRAQVLSVFDSRNGVRKPVFRLAPVGHEQKFNVIAPGLNERQITDDVLRKLVDCASNPAQNCATNV